MTQPLPNLDLINRVVTQIEMHPDTWDQETLIGGERAHVTHCFAGWAIELSGIDDDRLENMPATHLAAELLGVTDIEAYGLFIPTAEWSDITAMLDVVRARYATQVSGRLIPEPDDPNLLALVADIEEPFNQRGVKP